MNLESAYIARLVESIYTPWRMSSNSCMQYGQNFLLEQRGAPLPNGVSQQSRLPKRAGPDDLISGRDHAIANRR